MVLELLEDVSNISNFNGLVEEHEKGTKWYSPSTEIGRHRLWFSHIR
jgi:hypothetical protein